MNPPYLRLLVLSLTLIPLSGTPSGRWNKPFPKQEGGYDQRISQPNDTAGTLGIPDSTCYFADFSLMAESMSLLMGETQHSATVAKKSAPFYLFPSPAVRQDMNKLQPLLMESLELKARIAASASAFDAAWEEVITCASLESEEGVRSALANAGGPNGPALKKANDHWRKVFGVLDKFGKGDLDPLSASRQIRELSGGKSITEVLDDMTTLMETVGKL